MERKRRTEILIKGRRKMLEHMVAHIRSMCEIKVVEKPNVALTMIKMRERGKGGLFYIGEVIVTEAKVYVEGALGIGIISGIDEEKALDLAIIDGFYKLNLGEEELFYEILLREEARIKALEVRKKDGILKTKINFDTMEV
ncbi:MAG: phosphonate C-P lyase system protein PhnG [Clostridium sp.]